MAPCATCVYQSLFEFMDEKCGRYRCEKYKRWLEEYQKENERIREELLFEPGLEEMQEGIHQE